MKPVIANLCYQRRTCAVDALISYLHNARSPSWHGTFRVLSSSTGYPTSQRSDFTKIRLPKDPTSQKHSTPSMCPIAALWYPTYYFHFAHPHDYSMSRFVHSLTFVFWSLTFAHFCVFTHFRILFTHFCSLLRFHSLSHFVHSLLLTFAFCSLTFAFCSLAFVRDSPVVRTELKRQYSISKLRVEPANETMQ